MKPVYIAIALLVGLSYHATGQTKNKWVLKLNKPLEPNLGILIQHGGPGVPLYDKFDIPNAQIVDYLKQDTMYVPLATLPRFDYKYFELAPPCKKVMCQLYMVNYNGRTLWIKEVDLMRINLMNIGEYKISGRVFHAVMMLPNPKVVGDQCVSVQTMMMYDDQHLYLIDATRLNNSSLHWKEDLFFSWVDPPRFSVQPKETKTDAHGDFIMTWEILGERKNLILKLTWEDNHIVLKSYKNEMIPDAVYGIPDDTTKMDTPAEVTQPVPKDETVYTDEVHTDVCSFVGTDAGDCGHIEFSCGDFGDAETRQLSAADSKLWFQVINGAYAGRTFTMTYKIVQGRKCGAPDHSGNYYSDGPVQGLLTFRLNKQ